MMTNFKAGLNQHVTPMSKLVTTLAASVLASLALTSTSIADDDDWDDEREDRRGSRGGYHSPFDRPGFQPGDHRFAPRDAALRVFIEFDSIRDLRREENTTSRREQRLLDRQDRFSLDRTEADVLSAVAQQVPGSVRFVDTPRRADLIIRAIPERARFNFGIVDVTPKQKTKGKRYHRRTYRYDRVEEQASLRVAYTFSVRVPGQQRYQTTFRNRVSDHFVYATNIQGFGPAAYDGDRVTINRVRELAARNTPQYRRQIMRGLKRQAEADVAYKIADIIRYQHAAFYEPARHDVGPAIHHPAHGRGAVGRYVGVRPGIRIDLDTRPVRDAARIGLAAGVIALLAAEAID